MKSDAAIERETSRKWAKLSIQCFRRYFSTGLQGWLIRAHGYRHEALEHAATVGDKGKFVKKMQEKIEKVMKKGKR